MTQAFIVYCRWHLKEACDALANIQLDIHSGFGRPRPASGREWLLSVGKGDKSWIPSKR